MCLLVIHKLSLSMLVIKIIGMSILSFAARNLALVLSWFMKIRIL